LSSIVFPNNNVKTSEDGVYLRVDGYYLILAHEENGKNLISHFFNLNEHFGLLLEA